MKSKEEIANKHGILSGKDSEFDDAILNAMQEYATQYKYDMAQDVEFWQEDMVEDIKYWQGEYENWHKQAMEMADELKKLKEIINGSL